MDETAGLAPPSALHKGGICSLCRTEIGLHELSPLFEHAGGDEEISIRKKWTTEPRHGATIRQRQHECQRRTADPRGSSPAAGKARRTPKEPQSL